MLEAFDDFLNQQRINEENDEEGLWTRREKIIEPLFFIWRTFVGKWGAKESDVGKRGRKVGKRGTIGNKKQEKFARNVK